MEPQLAHQDNAQLYELSSISTRALSTADTPTALDDTVREPVDEVHIQELPEIDGGWKAWRFCAAGFVLEVMIWGFEFRYDHSRSATLC